MNIISASAGLSSYSSALNTNLNAAFAMQSGSSSESSVVVFHPRQKTIGEVAGEFILRPIIDKVAAIWNKVSILFFNQKAEKKPIEIHEHIFLEPGKNFLWQSTNRINLCKTKPAPEDTVGPKLKITLIKRSFDKQEDGYVIETREVLFRGEIEAETSWWTSVNKMSNLETILEKPDTKYLLHIKNDSPSVASIFVHAENE